MPDGGARTRITTLAPAGRGPLPSLSERLIGVPSAQSMRPIVSAPLPMGRVSRSAAPTIVCRVCLAGRRVTFWTPSTAYRT